MTIAGQRNALIVATGRYDDPKLRRLRGPAADAERLAKVLRDPAIGGFEVELAADEDERALRRRIARFFAAAARDDVLLMHVSCHGVKDAGGRLHLAASDTEIDLLDATAVSAAWLDEQMSRSPSRRKVLLLDCCFSGKFPFNATARRTESLDVQERFQGRGRAVITASNAMEYAFEGDQLSGEGHPSHFTAAVVEALESGKADRDQDHWISIDELYDYVFERVKETSPDQTPSRQFALEGPLYIARSTYQVPLDPVPLDSHLVNMIESPMAAARLAAVDELGRLLDASDRGVALSARQHLQALVTDDSRRVSARAQEELGQSGPGVASVSTADVKGSAGPGQEDALEAGHQSTAQNDAAEFEDEAACQRADARGSAVGAYELGCLLEARADKRGAEDAFARADQRGSEAGAYRHGLLLLARGDKRKAEASFKRADERGSAKGANNLGLLLLERNDTAGAEAAFARGDERGSVIATVNLAWRLLARGERERAESLLVRADARGSAVGALRLGRLLEARDDKQGAVSAYRHADERGSAEAAVSLGAILEADGDNHGAEAAYERADQRGSADGADNHGRLLEARGDESGAEAAYRRADELDSPLGANNLGVLLEGRGDPGGAEAAFKRADARGSALGAYNLSRVLAARGNRRAAKGALRRAQARGM